jgi:hypothetical protein
MIGHWEGDWSIRDAFDKTAPANQTKAAAMVRLLSAKQRAVDDAKRDSPWARNVFVWHYAEANLVEQSLQRGQRWPSMVNTVIPAVRPVIDFVSVSVGGDSLREPNPAPALHRVCACNNCIWVTGSMRIGCGPTLCICSRLQVHCCSGKQQLHFHPVCQ